MKILVLRFSSIGDIVLTTPVVRALAQQVPGAEVHFATKPGYRGLLDANPYVAKVHVLGGSFNSRLMHDLREVKGYTYGISARFQDLDGRIRRLVLRSGQ